MVARDREELSGQQIGNYEVVSHIAARKASDLFLARDVKLERLVFLEVLRVTANEDLDLVDRFGRRMETVAQLKDPHIAAISDIDYTDDGYPYAVIEHFPGVSLAEKLAGLKRENRTLPVIESLELMKQIAQGLGVAHSADLIHHDLRPENLMIREDGSPVFIDLGVPVEVGQRTTGLTGPESDMLDYASPEELDGKDLTRRSNIYSLGIILYELLAGHRPMLPTLPFDIFPQANMPKETPLEEARPGLAGETYRLVRNCLWRQEWSRYETTDELITAIETAIFAEQELPKTAIRNQRSRSPLAYVIPIALVFFGILAFFLLRGSIGGDAEAAEPTDVAGGILPTLDGSPVADGTATPTVTPTFDFPTESASLFSISVLAPGANRQFTTDDTINFDWFWPTLPEPGWNFAVFLQQGAREYLLGRLTEPNNGAAYRLSIPGADLPVNGEGLTWQIRLETEDGAEVLVASDRIPIGITLPAAGLTATPTVTAELSPTPSLTPETCIVSPPPGWILYTVRQGDAIAGLAQRANIPVEDLLRENCLENDLLSVGQQLWVPQAAVPRTPTATIIIFPTVPPATNPPPTNPPQPTNPPATNPPPPTNTPPPPTDEPTTEPPTRTPPVPDTPAP